jgi:hypothetical protein
MTGEMILSLLILYLISGLIFLYIVYRLFYYKSKQIENKYFLFRFRDELILLVAKGKLDEDEFLFKEFYPGVNHIINEINTFRFRHLIKAISSQEDFVKGGKFAERIDEELKQKPKEVRKVFTYFYYAIVYIIYRNSLLFRILYRASGTFKFLKKCVDSSKLFLNFFKYQNKAYQYVEFCYARKDIKFH